MGGGPRWAWVGSVVDLVGSVVGLVGSAMGLVGSVGSVVGLVGSVVGLVVGRVGGAHPPFLGGCPSPLPTTTIKSKKEKLVSIHNHIFYFLVFKDCSASTTITSKKRKKEK